MLNTGIRLHGRAQEIAAHSSLGEAFLGGAAQETLHV
jgi:branched-chain amino acid transport system ATP-binding protein